MEKDREWHQVLFAYVCFISYEENITRIRLLMLSEKDHKILVADRLFTQEYVQADLGTCISLKIWNWRVEYSGTDYWTACFRVYWRFYFMPMSSSCGIMSFGSGNTAYWVSDMHIKPEYNTLCIDISEGVCCSARNLLTYWIVRDVLVL